MPGCEYKRGCLIEPLVAEQDALTQERDRLYASVREINNQKEAADLIARAQRLEAIINNLKTKKNYLHPLQALPLSVN